MSIQALYPPMRGLANTPWFYGLSGLIPSSSSSTARVTLTASATTHTKGAWTQLVASSADETGLLVVSYADTSTAATEVSVLLDLATGAGGSESAFASNIAIGGADSNRSQTAGNGIYLPIYIPSGRRIAARIQSNIASRTATVAVGLYRTTAMQMLPASLDVLGTSTATSRGTPMSGASGTYTEITASTARAYAAILIVASNPTASSISAAFTLTAAVGAAGAEVDIGGISCNSLSPTAVAALAQTPWGFPIAANIPAGSRLAVKHNLASNPGNVAATIIGVPR